MEFNYAMKRDFSAENISAHVTLCKEAVCPFAIRSRIIIPRNKGEHSQFTLISMLKAPQFFKCGGRRWMTATGWRVSQGLVFFTIHLARAFSAVKKSQPDEGKGRFRGHN